MLSMGSEDVPSVAAALVATARAALAVTAGQLAAVAGCPTALVVDIERGSVDPVLDTVERILNSVALELRAGPAARSNPAYTGGSDPAEVARVRQAVDKQCAFRAQHGLPPPGPPPGTGPVWDGSDPAPSRPVGAGPHRSSSRSWSALVLAAAGLPSPVGPVRAGELQRLLAAVGLSLHVRVEPYDDHDDLLHLAAVTDPVRHRLLISRTEQALAAAALS